MIRTFEFYEDEYKITRMEISRIEKIVNDFEKGIIDEEKLGSLGLNGLKFCIAEGKIDTLIKLISPIEYQNGPHRGKKYFMDAISLGLVEHINSLPSSIMERYAKMYREQEDEHYSNEEEDMLFAQPKVSIMEAAYNAVILTPDMKKRIMDALLTIDLSVIKNIKIKDVFARQVPGMGFPIRSERDVAFYSEISNYVPCLNLFRKNIQTTSNDTLGCKDDGPMKRGKLEISINYDSLNERNKLLASAIIERGYGYLFKSFVSDGSDLMISVPCLPEETIENANARMMKIVSKFQKQDILYGVISREEVIKNLKTWARFSSYDIREKMHTLLFGDVTDSELKEAMSLIDLGYVFDEDGTIYRDQYCLDKHREYLMENGGIAPKKAID